MKRFGRGCLIAVVVLVVLGGIAAALNGGGNTANTPAVAPTAVVNAAVEAPASEAAPEPTAVPEPTIAPTAAPAVGVDVQVGEVRWKVVEATDVGQTLKGESEFVAEKTTSGKYVRVRFEMENLSKDMLSFTGVDLVDDQERKFTRSTDLFQYAPEAEWCAFENLNPNVPKTCTLIYELPANAAGLKLRVGDMKLLGSKEALIDLGF